MTQPPPVQEGTSSGRFRGGMAKIGGFAASTVLTSVVSVLTIPVLVARAGADGWAQLAVGQAVGTVLSVLVAFGWGVTGPHAVAVLHAAEVRGYYLQSTRIRTVLFALASGPAIVAILLLANGQVLAAVLMGLSVMAGNLSGGWLYVGMGRPTALLLLDTLPRVVALILGAVLVGAGAGLSVFAAVQLASSLLTAGIAVSSALRLPQGGDDGRYRGVRAALDVLRGQRSAVVVALTASLYVSAPLLAVSAFAPSSTALYAVGDRILKFSLNGLNPIAQALQGWIPSAGPAALPARCRTAARASFLLGAAGALVLVPVLLLGSPLLTAGQVRLTPLLAVVFAAVFAAIAVSRIVGLVCLVALGRVGALAASTVTGAILGVAALLAFTPSFGVLGAASAFLVSEVGVSAVQLRSMRRALRSADPA